MSALATSRRTWFNALVDWIAFASVVSSAVVATATVVVNALSKRGDRKHASGLDFEKRSWELKSAALLEVVGACVQMDRVTGGPDPQPSLATYEITSVDRQLRTLTGPAGATVTALGHAATSTAMEALLAFVNKSLGPAMHDLTHVVMYRDSKEAAIDAREFEAAAEHRHSEKAALELYERWNVTLNREKLRELVNQLRESAQKDIKGQL